MFHDIRRLRSVEITAEAFALAVLDLTGGEIIRVFGYDDDNREVDLNYGVVHGDRVHDADGDHPVDKWLVTSSQRAVKDDFWCHERLRPQDIDALRTRTAADDMESARLIALTSVMDSPMLEALRSGVAERGLQDGS